MMGKRDYTGTRHGRRVITGPDATKGGYWLWECECGARGSSKPYDFSRNYYCRKCPDRVGGKGVLQTARWVDHTGERYGARVITGRVDSKKPVGNKIKWSWRCDCGNVGASNYHTIKVHTACASCLSLGVNPIGSMIGARLITARATELQDIGKVSKWHWRCTICGYEGISMLRHLRRYERDTCICPVSRSPKTWVATGTGKQLVDLEPYIGQTIGRRTIVALGPVIKRSRTLRWVCACGNEGHSPLGKLRLANRCEFCADRHLVFGRYMNITEMHKVFGVSRDVIRKRVDSGMSFEEAVLRPRMYWTGPRPDRTGEKVGSRTITGMLPPLPNDVYKGYRCKWRCDCGNTGVSVYDNLLRLKPCIYCTLKERRLVSTSNDAALLPPAPAKSISALRRVKLSALPPTPAKPIPGPHGGQNAAPSLLGKRFGQKTVIGDIPYTERHHNRRWRWRCDCGAEGTASRHTLLTGRSCQRCAGRLFTVFGESKSLTELCKEYGLGRNAIYYRLHKGMTIEEAVVYKRSKESGQ